VLDERVFGLGNTQADALKTNKGAILIGSSDGAWNDGRLSTHASGASNLYHDLQIGLNRLHYVCMHVCW
jgi:hypothetical protein